MKINKQFKIWKAAGNDDFHPAYEYIHFIDNHAIATEAHILAKVETVSLFEFPLPGEDTMALTKLNGYSIHAALYRKLANYDTMWIEEDENGPRFCIQWEEQVVRISLVKTEKLHVPDFAAVLDKAGLHREAIYEIGINPKLLMRLADALGADATKLMFTKKNGTIFVYPAPSENYDAVGLIMPHRIP